MRRRLGLLTLAAVGLAAFASLLNAGPVAAQSVSRTDAIRQLDTVRRSIDETLSLMKSGHADAALVRARSGYLDHFELVEIPLRVVDPRLTVDAEAKFAEVRQLIRAGASTSALRDQIIELRRLIDRAERRLTDEGISAPTLVAGQSFLIIFREGLEIVLLLSVLLGYLEAARASAYKRPIVLGAGLAVVATGATFIGVQTLFRTLPFPREVLEAVTAIVAVAVLFYVSFWLIARLEQKRWMEFLRARVWNAASVGSAASLMLIGFTAVYREGFETALFYQALVSFGDGLYPWLALGLGLGLVALAVVALAVFRLGRQIPLRTFMSTAVVLVMATSVAFIGNAVAELQEADVVHYTRLSGWPRPPIFVSQAVGFWPTTQTVTAQAVLASIYLLGGFYMFVVRPRRRSSLATVSTDTTGSSGAETARAGDVAAAPR